MTNVTITLIAMEGVSFENTGEELRRRGASRAATIDELQQFLENHPEEITPGVSFLALGSRKRKRGEICGAILSYIFPKKPWVYYRPIEGHIWKGNEKIAAVF